LAAVLTGDRDFIEACERIKVELRTTERTRESLGQPKLSPNERQEAIIEIVRTYVHLHVSDDDEEEEEWLKVRS
jgi:hypothetical protein